MARKFDPLQRLRSAQIARILGVNRSTVSRWMRGVTHPSPLARALFVSVGRRVVLPRVKGTARAAAQKTHVSGPHKKGLRAVAKPK